MVAVHFEEQCAYDDDYGKKRPIHLFEYEAHAKGKLLSMGYKQTETSNKLVCKQYHSEMVATIYDVVDNTE